MINQIQTGMLVN